MTELPTGKDTRDRNTASSETMDTSRRFKRGGKGLRSESGWRDGET
jgi:hypothetical protein